MNILKTQSAKELKKAFSCGLIICGVEDGKVLWLGTKVQLANYLF